MGHKVLDEAWWGREKKESKKKPLFRTKLLLGLSFLIYKMGRNIGKIKEDSV